MAYRVLPAGDAFWRPSNQMGVRNTDLAKQLGATTLGARLWRLAPGQASTRHRHAEEERALRRARGHAAASGSATTCSRWRRSRPCYVEAATVRQVFNDTEADALWLVAGAPPEAANTLEMTPERLAFMYPDGPKALPPELA